MMLIIFCVLDNAALLNLISITINDVSAEETKLINKENAAMRKAGIKVIKVNKDM